MKVYRLLTGVDDSAFCHKVSLALSKGWVLEGGPAYAFDAKEGVMKCAQAVTKTVDGRDYEPGMTLGEA